MFHQFNLEGKRTITVNLQHIAFAMAVKDQANLTELHFVNGHKEVLKEKYQDVADLLLKQSALAQSALAESI